MGFFILFNVYRRRKMLKSVGPCLATLSAFYIPVHCVYVVYGSENYKYVAVMTALIVWFAASLERKIYEIDYGKLSIDEEEMFWDVVDQKTAHLLIIFMVFHFISVFVYNYQNPCGIGEWVLPTALMYYLYFHALDQREKTLIIIFLSGNAISFYDI